jgi:arylsulfatase A-like enzyme
MTKIILHTIKMAPSFACILMMTLFCNTMVAQNKETNLKSDDRPNIVLIMTDQQQAQALSCAGNLDLKTPNLDKLAKSGIRFQKTYVSFPLCSPSRSSMFTGKMPHTLGIDSNEKEDIAMKPMDKENGLGNVLRKAGYDCAYGGKWHAPEAEMAPGNGFDKIAGFGDIPLAQKCIDYLSSKRNSDQPFFLVASFDNPHNICEWARNEPLPYGNIPTVATSKTPELPVNFKKTGLFPEALQNEQSASKLLYPVQNYTEEDWRQYRYTYYQLIEKVDSEIGKIIDAIDKLGMRDNTLIIFTSDHGDGNASHGWNQKTALFEEVINVPFIVSYKGMINAGTINQTSIISNGLDLFPSLCDYASIKLPEKLLGKSIKPLLEGKVATLDREFIVVETKFDGKQAFGTSGRAVIGKKYKYVLYNWGKNREQFFDIDSDPFEMNNLAGLEIHSKRIDEYRQHLMDWCTETKDTKFLRKLILPTNSSKSSSDLFDRSY